jgi:cytosine/adenosine deaminase-related metal-dependent hydrolase
MRADIAIWDMADLTSLGAWDQVAALVLAPPAGVRDLFVEGRAVVRGGDLAQVRRTDVLRAASRSLDRLKALL